jgi:hypothetical protein
MRPGQTTLYPNRKKCNWLLATSSFISSKTERLMAGSFLEPADSMLGLNIWDEMLQWNCERQHNKSCNSVHKLVKGI